VEIGIGSIQKEPGSQQNEDHAKRELRTSLSVHKTFSYAGISFLVYYFSGKNAKAYEIYAARKVKVSPKLALRKSAAHIVKGNVQTGVCLSQI
jgi:hypothetical protein